MLARTLILGKVPFPGLQEQDQQDHKMVWRERFSDLRLVGMIEEMLVERIARIYFQLGLRYRPKSPDQNRNRKWHKDVERATAGDGDRQPQTVQ